MSKVISPQSLLDQAIEKYGSMSAVAKKMKVFRSTLKRIKNGSTIAPHTETLAKLVKAING